MTRIAHDDATADIAQQLVDAAIYTGIYRQAAEAFPVTWRKGVKLVQDGQCQLGYGLLLTALIGTPEAAQAVFTTIQLRLRGDI